MKTKPLSANSLGYARADKRLEILHLVGQHGSISQAARSAGVSYKAAWQAVHTLTNLAGELLVDSSVGGTGGGGARLTLAGMRLLEAAGQMDAARREVLQRINSPSVGALTGPRTSMRNHLPCTVARLESAGDRDPVVRVVLALPGGDELASLVTRESIELLSLEPGLQVLALCKATAVRMEAGDAGQRGDNFLSLGRPETKKAPSGGSGPREAGERGGNFLSLGRPETKKAPSGGSGPREAGERGGNSLAGRVLRVARGTLNDELALTLSSGQQLVGFAARPNRLRIGSKAWARIEESAVVLALG